MWKHFWQKKTEPAPVPADHMSPDACGLHVYRVRRPEGFQDLVSILPESIVFEHGVSSEAIVGMCTELLAPGVAITVENFRPGLDFAKVLHEVIAKYAPDTADFQAAARREGSGHLLVIDPRTPTPHGPIPAEDIVGRFAVLDGSLVPDSYEPNFNHRLLTSQGWFRLAPEIRIKLVERLINGPGAPVAPS